MQSAVAARPLLSTYRERRKLAKTIIKSWCAVDLVHEAGGCVTQVCLKLKILGPRGDALEAGPGQWPCCADWPALFQGLPN